MAGDLRSVNSARSTCAGAISSKMSIFDPGVRDVSRPGGTHASRSRDHDSGSALRRTRPAAQPGIHVLRGADHRARPRRQRRHLQPGRRRAAQVVRLPRARAHRPVVGEAAARPAQRHLRRELHRLGAAEPVVRGDGGADRRDDELHRERVGDGRHATGGAASRGRCASASSRRRTSRCSARSAALGRTFARDEDQPRQGEGGGPQPSAVAEPVRRRCRASSAATSC